MTDDQIRMELSSIVIAIGRLGPGRYVERARYRSRQHELRAEVVFLHWPYPPAVVQRLLPAGVEADTHDGVAWVGLVPFNMERLGLPGLPPLPRLGAFPEVNVRTYVYSGPRRGVWFFSLDIDKILPTAVARLAYRVPYCYGRARHTHRERSISSRVDRRWPTTGEAARAEIDIRTEVERLDEGLVSATGLPAPEGEPHVLWSPGVDVRVGRPTRITDQQEHR